MTNMLVFDQKQEMAATYVSSHSASQKKKEDMFVKKKKQKKNNPRSVTNNWEFIILLKSLNVILC